MSEQIYIGIDLGGTSIKLGLCNEQGDLLHTYEGPTGTEHGTDAVLDNIVTYVHQIVAQSPFAWDQVAGVGAGMAGFIDLVNGVVKFAPNLSFRDTPVRAVLEERLGKRIVVDNDANVAALGEAWAGAGKGIKHLICYTIGTGVGGGIIIGGRIHQGFSGMAGELGHMAVVPDLEAIQCGCGKMGCLETVSSATGIIRMGKDAVGRGDRTSLTLIEQPLTAKHIFDAAKSGDEVSMRIINRAAFYLGKSMATLAVVINPQRFVLGGGVSLAGEIFLQPIRDVFRQFTPEQAQEGVEIVPAILGNDAGVVGAAGLLLR